MPCWCCLGAATAVIKVLKRRPESGIDPAILETFGLRVRAWWILLSTLAAAFLLGHVVTVILFGLISFWALREFITLTPTRPGDHRTLFWVFFLITPLQFLLVGIGCYEFYSIMIPVYAFLLVPARIALAGDYKRFLERTAKIQSGLLICVYCLSYAPALLMLKMPEGEQDIGGRCAASLFLCADGSTERRPAIRVGADAKQTCDRAHDQLHTHLGRTAGRHRQRDANRRCVVVGNALPRQPVGGWQPSCRPSLP